MFQTTLIERGSGVCFVGTGIVTAAEIKRAKIAFGACEDRVKLIRFAIIDLQETTQLVVSSHDLRTLADIDMRLSQLTPSAIVAVVAPREHVFGLARMWEVLVEATGWRIGVFRSSAEACEWLAHWHLPQLTN